MPTQQNLPKAWGTPGQAMEKSQPTQGPAAESMQPQQQMDPRDAAMQRALDTNSVSNIAISDEVHDVASDPSIVSRLDWEIWLPFAAQKYKLSPRISDYLIVSTLICPSEIPNRNGIAFPTAELAMFRLPPTNRLVWEAWKGCPVCLEHNNENPEEAIGVILDTSFQKVAGYGGGKVWKVMGLLAIDKTKNPEIAQKVLDGRINTYSMGALVDYFTCGYCGTECSDRYTCAHIRSTKVVNWNKYRDFDGSTHLSFLNAHGIQPIECSVVADPAWAPALSDQVFDPFSPSGRDGPLSK